MVLDSRQPAVAEKHRSLAQLLKTTRAEGHFAGLSLVPAIQVYDFALPAHASSARLLGLSTQETPSLCLVELSSASLPAKVLWKSQYDNAEVVLKSLDQRLGIANRDQPKVPPLLVLVGSSTDPAWLEAQAKVKSLLAQEWKTARIESFTQQESLADVPAPGLALVDPTSKKIFWQKDLLAPDSTLQSLGSRLGLVYKVPDQLLWEKDGSELLRVSGGKVSIGSDERADDCKPRHTFDLKEAYYYLGKTEVTVAQFRRFVQATQYQTDAERAGRSFVFQGKGFTPVAGANWKSPRANGPSPDNFPVVHITYNDATAYTSWAGLRLPGEQEWEHAGGGKNFPWGDIWDGNRCRHSVGLGIGNSGGPTAVGFYPNGASPWGCLDMAGNVYEWTSSLYARYTQDSPPANSRMNGLRKVIRGGSFGNDEVEDFWITRRTAVGSQDSTEAQGFRVCLDGTRPQP